MVWSLCSEAETTGAEATTHGNIKIGKQLKYKMDSTSLLTLVTTDNTAIPFRISCQTPILWALEATGLRN